MKEEIIISGFGGQGVLSMGKLLAYAGMKEGKEVSWLPAYGPEQRGGTANVTVILSDQKIASPILSTYHTAILLNQPSLDRFLPKIQPGGTLIYDTYGIAKPPSRHDINIYEINAMDAAAKLKNIKTFNMVILGGLIKVNPIVTIDDIRTALYETLPERHHHLIPLNEEALRLGGNMITKVSFGI
ncbi:MAG: 2-oxoacid:acceptor oxidoreductase family protein [Prevotellaceae bacterium]|nr:2-oxoacid:acceptor oxidoreductase family protein [Prevotellaceae bacterium]MDY3857059.1 2-oxoacid:acceptor oxidoreductase family protein [Bacteroidaceae bacterium]